MPLTKSRLCIPLFKAPKLTKRKITNCIKRRGMTKGQGTTTIKRVMLLIYKCKVYKCALVMKCKIHKSIFLASYKECALRNRRSQCVVGLSHETPREAGGAPVEATIQWKQRYLSELLFNFTRGGCFEREAHLCRRSSQPRWIEVRGEDFTSSRFIWSWEKISRISGTESAFHRKTLCYFVVQILIVPRNKNFVSFRFQIPFFR